MTEADQRIELGYHVPVEYARDQLGRATQITYPDPCGNGIDIDFTYTSLDQVNTISRSTSGLVSYDYAGGYVSTRSYAGVTDTPVYGDFGRVATSLAHSGSDPCNLLNLTYTYDRGGSYTKMGYHHVRNHDCEDDKPWDTFAYDDLDRLTQMVHHDMENFDPTYTESFTYDTLGNRLTSVYRDGCSVDYDHNVANEYTAIGGTGVVHDFAGNLTSDAAGYEYHYDYENRLTQVVYDSSPVGEFAYDALGRRIEKYDPSSDSLRTRYYYDGWRVLSEHDGDDENQPMFRYFVYGNYIDEVVMMRNVLDDDSRILGDFYYVYDAQYNCRALFASIARERIRYDAYGLPHVRYVADMEINDPSNGIIGDGDVDTNDWPIFRDAFGKTQCDSALYRWLADYDNDGDVDTNDFPYWRDYFGTGTTEAGFLSFYKNPYSFTGRRFDSLDSGALILGYYRNRYYDPVTGRWITADPLGVRSGICLVEFEKISGRPALQTSLRLQGGAANNVSNTGSVLRDVTDTEDLSTFGLGFVPRLQYADTLNLYEFVRNAPDRHVDPYGLRTWGIFDSFYDRTRNCTPWRAAGEPKWDSTNAYVPILVFGTSLPTDPVTGIILATLPDMGMEGRHGVSRSFERKLCIREWCSYQLCKRCCTVKQRVYSPTRQLDLSGQPVVKVSYRHIEDYTQKDTLRGGCVETPGVVVHGNCVAREPQSSPPPQCPK